MSSGVAAQPEGADRSQDLTRRLWVLMAARGVAALAVLGVTWLLAGTREAANFNASGIYATGALALATTAFYAAIFRRIPREDLFGFAQLVTDIALVTALVYYSGGSASIFTFLYLPLTVYAAVLLDRRGAYGSAALNSLAYGGVLVFERDVTGVSQVALWTVHTGALVLVALLSSVLSRELRRADVALDRSAQDLGRLRRLHQRTVESLTSGLLTTDPKGLVTSFNAEAVRITGVSRQDALSTPIDRVIPGAHAAVMGRESGRQRSRMEFRNRLGRSLHLGLASSVLREEDGSPAGHVIIFQDVTQVVEMEAELRRAERLAAVGQLAADMAHEVRNPLAAISGSIQMLQGSMGQDTIDRERLRLMEIAMRETDRLDALIRDFLQFARPSPPKKEPVHVAPAISKVLEMFESVRPESVEVAVSVDPALKLLGDADQLTQVAWNLILNAVQALPHDDGGRLEIGGAALAPASQGTPGGRRNDAEEGTCGWGELTVSDTGAGIPPEVLDRVFDPFFTTKQGGSGLGLATVHRIVEENGGKILVETEVGLGTTFRIRLPLAEEDA